MLMVVGHNNTFGDMCIETDEIVGVGGISTRSVPNKDRKFWQFWKSKDRYVITEY